MRKQLYVSRKPNFPVKEKLHFNNQNTGIRSCLGAKPTNAFWTSTYLNKKHGSDWIQWALGEDFYDGVKLHAYTLEVEKDAKILVIDSMDDLYEVVAKYPNNFDAEEHDEFIRNYMMRFPNWNSISNDYDAVHLTYKGEAQTRWNQLDMINGCNLYGWDCESTCWFRWKFKNVKEIETNFISIP